MDGLDRLLNAFLRNCPIGLAIQDDQGRFLTLNSAMAALLSSTVDVVIQGRDPAVRARASRLLDLDAGSASSAQPLFREVALDAIDGVTMALVCHFPLAAAGGRLLARGSLVLDVTERKRLEERLVHAQKMEAVGRLTGGIAHDYNNMLGVITGNLELLNLDLPEEPQLRGYCEAALRAADRSADLTRQLLTFARRQTLRPKVTDVGALVTSLRSLLTLTLRETIVLNLEIQRGATPYALVDPGQLENALLNLAINSRDAMPDGGRFGLRVETLAATAPLTDGRIDIPPGAYVRIVATDTGGGMSPDTLAKATDPFFTTKGDRGGTGLGLSMVQGFAGQSGGFLSIHSQLARGTEVRLYLPQVEAPAEIAPSSADTEPPVADSLRILVLEDDAELRRTVAAMLEGLGHDVLLADTGETALQILHDRSDIDVLLTDIMLPGVLNGIDVARRAREIDPRLAIVLATGHVEGSEERPIAIPEGLPLLHKPFRLVKLDRSIRDAHRAQTAAIAEAVAQPPSVPALGADGLDPTIIVDRSFLKRCTREMRELFALWERLKGDDVLPRWSTLDPFAIMPFLDSAALVEVRRDPLDFVYRAAGRTEIEGRGYDPAGRTVSEWHFGSTRAHVLASYRYVTAHRSFLYDWERAVSPTGKYIEDQTLFLPFTVAGETVDKILIFCRLTPRQQRDLDLDFTI